MKLIISLLVAATMLVVLLESQVQGAETGLIYQSPLPESQLVQPESTIIFRFEETVNVTSLRNSLLQVSGSRSGEHEGTMYLAQDKRTVIFTPVYPYTPGETVGVKLRPGLLSTAGRQLSVDEFRFTISSQPGQQISPQSLIPSEPRGMWLQNVTGLPLKNQTRNQYVTLPSNFPEINITVPTNDTDDGFIFLSNFVVDWRDRDVSQSKPYLLILDNKGEPVFYRAMRPGLPTMDFKKQPNGLLTYGEWAGIFYAMDSSYNIVKTYQAGNGYRTDIHDLQVLANDHALLMIYDIQQMDMTAYGGQPKATVVGLVIQELDAEGNVVFQWRSWDHFDFEESTADLTQANIDYVHGNSIELDSDGGLLLSSRAMNEVTKIDLETGKIVWRLGGKANEFDFVGDPDRFFAQHDARRLSNGNITIFDNHAIPGSTFARAVEYEIEEENDTKTATKVWEHRSGAMSPAMGNVQRLPNGNTMIGWGTFYPTLSEVTADGKIAFELTLAALDNPNLTQNSYRAFRFEWEGNPKNEPMLVARSESPGITTLYTSWNGATEVSAYRVYAGRSSKELTPVKTVQKSGFETQILVADAANEYCFLRVMPLDADGKEMRFSNLALAEQCIEGRVFLPINMVAKGNS